MHKGTRPITSAAVFVVAFAFAARGATPALPDPVNGVVTLENRDYVITENDDLTGITSFQTTGGWLVFDISQGSFDVDAAIKGTGGIRKEGEGALYLKYRAKDPNSNNAHTSYQTTLGMHIVAGELHLPNCGANTEVSCGTINIEAGAKLFVAGSDSASATGIRTLFSNLTGSGLVTNSWSQSQTIQQAGGTTSTNFSGVIAGNFANFWIYPSGNTTLTGTASTFTCGTMPGFGVVRLLKIGYDATEPSSAGMTSVFTLGPNGGNMWSGIEFLGTSGETTVKSVVFGPWHASVTQRCYIDAGAGGLIWNGAFSFGRQPMVYAILCGNGAATNEFGGTMSESSTGASYLEKDGAGTWLIRGDNPRKGVTHAREGTLQFETLREKGTQCSLGLSTFTHSAYSGAVNESKAVPYAIALGGGSMGEATLECVGREGSEERNLARERLLALDGDGRLKTTCPQPFELWGVTTISSSPCTLALDGANSESVLVNVTNGTSALSVAKDGPGTWTLRGNVDFSGKLEVNDGTLVVQGGETINYKWYKYTMKTMNSYYSNGNDSCRVTHEFALYDADGVRRNVGLTSDTSQNTTALEPGTATVAANEIPQYYGWAFENSSFLLSNMFDDDGGTASYLAGRSNGTNENTWISVVMRLPDETPPITSFDLISTTGQWNRGTRRVVAYSVSGSMDGQLWDELSDQTTNETARFTSGWYSNGKAFAAGEVRPLPDNGIEIAPRPRWAQDSVQLTNVADVVVADGATLKADGAVVLRRLGAEIDSAGNIVKGGGTIDGFTVAEKGVFNISGGQFGGELLVPYTFMNIADAANFRSWTVAVGGVPAPKYKIVVSAEGVRVYPVGTIVIMR